MRRVSTKDRVVQHNLELLKDLLERSPKKKCKAWVELTTGEISAEPPATDKKGDWRAVQIELITKGAAKKPEIKIVKDTKTAATIFSFSGWTAKAKKTVHETVQTINERLEKIPRIEKVFAKSHKKTEKPQLIREAWYNIDREGAEKALDGKRHGTYLFRKDEYTAILEQELFHRFDGSVHFCVTLTYLDEMGIVRDKTLVQREKYLVIYNDNPHLLEPHYATLQQAMHAIDPTLTRPLKLHKKAA